MSNPRSPTGTEILAVAFGGGLGTGSRAGLLLALPEESGIWLTLAINVLGCVLLAALNGYAAHRPVNEIFRLGFGTGFCGAFTTFSTIMLFFVQLPVWAYLGYLILSTLGCLAAVHATNKVTHRLVRVAEDR